MSDTGRKELVKKYKDGYKNLKKSVENIPKKAWSFRPSESEWTIQEIVMHLADAEVHGYIRLRTLIAEPGETVKGYNQTAYAKALLYSDQDPKSALKLYKLLSKVNCTLLDNLPEGIDAHKIRHPEHGEWNIDSWLESYVGHVYGHIEQIRRNITKLKEI